MSRPINLTIDANSRKITKYQDLIKLYDTLSLSITVLNGVAPYDFTGKTVEVFLKKSDNTKVQQDTTLSGNVVNVIPLSNQASTKVGQVEGELIISDATGQITSSTFIYQVEGTISGEILQESQDDVPILDDLKAKIDTYNSQVASIGDNVNILTQKIVDATTAKNALQPVVDNANAFASTYKDIANAQVNIVNLNYVKDAAAEMIRDSIPSGFIQLSDLDYTYMSTNPNTIKTLADSIAYVNGYKIAIPKGTVITLDAPPVSGSRDDLVFLEAWKQTDASGAITWNWRLRVVSGVDFNTYSEGLGTNYGSPATTSSVQPQGGNAAPISVATFANWIYWFKKSGNVYNNIGNPIGSFTGFNDVGIYVSGDGTSAAKTALGTTDGYVYAIPMFRVHRRNSSGYSVANNNGSNSLFRPIFSNRSGTATMGVNGGDITSWTFANVSDYNNTNIGDIFSSPDKSQYHKVVSKNNNNNVTMQMAKGTGSTTFSTGISSYYRITNAPPTLLIADIIEDRDVIDIRHQVSLTGFNYQQLLEENFDKLLRGELQTNAKTAMIKHYHGIAKTPIDANTVFYSSFDGTVIPEVGSVGTLVKANAGYKSMPTGLGTNNAVKYPIDLTYDKFTIDMWSLGTPKFSLIGNTRIMAAWASGLNVYTGTLQTIYAPWNTNVYSHTRIVIDKINLLIKVYCNGVLFKSVAIDSAILSNLIANGKFTINAASNNDDNSYNLDQYTYMSDLSISNVDRGAVFATLPQDFIDGYARISPAFNEQRNVFSDALTSETDFVQVKATGGNGKAISTTQGTAGAWASGDKVKIKGLGGEVITGVIDSDTALARVVQDSTQPVSAIYLDDVSKLSVGDTFFILNPTSYNQTTVMATIASIDVVNKSITLTSPLQNGFWSVATGQLLFETTASSSSPTVKYLNGATLTDAVGTWSNLGTNEATFTLGINASLTTQDLYVTYSLNEVAGQGGISEVLTATLAGESNGKKLVVNPTVHVRDDFAGKVAGSNVVNSNIAKRTTTNNSNTSLLVPSGFGTELTDDLYANLSTLNGINVSSTTNVNGAVPQQLLSFNIIRELEDKFGPLPCGSDLASKIAYAKANIANIKCSWWGNGSCPSGNKAYLAGYKGSWGYAINSASATSSLVSYNISSASDVTINNSIQSDGFVHILAYTDASNGTISSTIYTDYCNIEIILNTPTGYDVLAPENPRRDDGKANILLVRKETKEIQSMFSRSNADGVVTYGDYVSYQGLAPTISYTDATLSVKAKNKNFIGDVGTGGYKSALTGIKESQLPTGVNRSYYMNSNNIGYFKLEDINNLISVNNNDLVNLLVDILRSYNSNSLGNLFASSATKKLRGFSFNHQTPRYIDVSNLLSKFNLSVNSYIITGLVVSYQGNLYLVIARTDVNGDKTVWFGNSSTNAAADVFYIPNRPLIK